MTYPDINTMEALILCGGQGTRLREETEFKPKPMVEIGRKPILWHIMRTYAHFGVKRFVLCLGYKGDVIRDYFLHFGLRNSQFEVNLSDNSVEVLDTERGEDWKVALIETGADTMTGGRLKMAAKYSKNDVFFATYGDGVANVDIAQLYAHHRAKGCRATLTTVHPSSRYGEIMEADGIVTSFREKPQTEGGWINGGFFVFDKKIFDEAPSDPDLVLEDRVLPKLAEAGDLSVYHHGGFWQCMDTYREAMMLNALWDSGEAPWAV